jgi:hypothetical protein
MAARHGHVARLPASRRDRGVLGRPLGAARTVAALLPERAHVSRAELLHLAQKLLDEPSLRDRRRRAGAMSTVLDWLEGFPGDSWQDRWLLSGADDHGRSWGPAALTPRGRDRLTAGLGVLIVLRALRPGYLWLSTGRLLGIYASYRQHNQAQAFAELTRQAGQHGFGEHEAGALNALTRVVIVTSRELRSGLTGRWWRAGWMGGRPAV